MRNAAEVTGPVCPSDLASPSLPAMDPVPDAVMQVITNPSHYSHGAERALALSPRDRRSLWFVPGIKETCTTREFIEAIVAADSYADDFETKAREYRETVRNAVESHCERAQEDIATLAGLIGAGS
jgi:hypothetical protein